MSEPSESTGGGEVLNIPKLEYACARCKRPAPTGSCRHLRGVPLGPSCFEVLQRREYIRASGPNRRAHKSPSTGLIHFVSDYDDVCPEAKEHCLQCPFLEDDLCPMERSYGYLFPAKYPRNQAPVEPATNTHQRTKPSDDVTSLFELMDKGN